MIELLRSNDPVLVSWVMALLKNQGVEAIMLDQHMSVLEGSIGALSRRIMVVDEDEREARSLLADAGIETSEPR
tara:strand:+ start:15 stop:236 length:222 start_codon:yes stop_codon:yes gene_type:complete